MSELSATRYIRATGTALRSLHPCATSLRIIITSLLECNKRAGGIAWFNHCSNWAARWSAAAFASFAAAAWIARFAASRFVSIGIAMVTSFVERDAESRRGSCNAVLGRGGGCGCGGRRGDERSGDADGAASDAATSDEPRGSVDARWNIAGNDACDAVPFLLLIVWSSIVVCTVAE